MPKCRRMGETRPIAWLPLLHGGTPPHVLYHASQDAMEDHCTGDLNAWVLILAQKLTNG